MKKMITQTMRSARYAEFLQYLRVCCGLVLLLLASVSVKAQPANDACDGVLPELVINAPAISADNSAAEGSDDAAGSCWFDSTVDNDLWFSVVAPLDGDLTIETFAVEGAGNADTQMDIFSACDGTPVEGLCNDDKGFFLDFDGAASIISVPCGTLIGGETYYVRVDGWNGNADPFTISASSESCAGPCQETTYAVSVSSGGFNGEVSWNLLDGQGEVILSGGAPFEGEACLADGCYSLELFDSFGDGWQGQELSISAEGQGIAVFTLPDADENFEAIEEVCVPIPAAPACEETTYAVSVSSGGFNGEVSWNLLDGQGAVLLSGGAPFEGEACLADGCYSLELFDSFGDGWQGQELSISAEGQETAVFTLPDADENFSSIEEVCVPIVAPTCIVDAVIAEIVNENCEEGTFQIQVSFGEETTPGTYVVSTSVDGVNVGSGAFVSSLDGPTIIDGSAFNSGDVVVILAENLQDETCNGSTSASFTCPPSNDLICNAEEIDCGGSIEGSTVAANPAANAPQCGFVSNTASGVWYFFDAPYNGNATLSTCGTAEFDTKISAYLAADCESELECVGANDDGPDCSGFSSLLDIEIVSGSRYYVLVHNFSGFTTPGAFTLSLSCEQVLCESPSLSLALSADEAGQEEVAECLEADGQFYVQATVDGGSGNTGYSILVNGEESVIGAEGVFAFGPFSQGTNVSIELTGLNDMMCGAEASISSPALCPPPAPENDECADALEIIVDDENPSPEYDYSAATGNPDDEISCGIFGETAVQRDIWFFFEAPADGIVTIETFSIPGAGSADTQIEVFDACGGDPIACNDDKGDASPENFTSRLIFECGVLEAEETYLVRVDSWGGDTDPFALTITTEDCPDPCADVICEEDEDPCTTLVGCVDGDCEFALVPDSDGDGSCDAIDGCPDDANKTEPGACGCGVADLDEDQDQIADCIDDCVGTPDAIGTCNGDCEADLNENGICDDDEEQPGDDCEDWVVYLADIASNGVTDIYSVSFDGLDANLDLIATSDIQVHIAFNEVDGLIYAVSSDDGSYRTLNPNAEAPEFSEASIIDVDVDKVVTAAFNEDGKLLIGDQDTDEIYCVDLSNNNVSIYDAASPIAGGDIAFSADDQLYLATRAGGGGLYIVMIDGIMDDILLPSSVPSLVTGMALSNTNQFLLSHNGGTTLEVRNLDGSSDESFNLKLDGADFESFNGDMASGCNDGNNNEGDCNYALYYTHQAQGGQYELYALALNDEGSVDGDDAPLANLGSSSHIALSPDGSLIYIVGGSSIRSYEVSSGILSANVNIFNGANGANLSGFPAAVADSDGNVFIAGAGSNVWQVNPATGEATNIASGISVNGGDLIFAPTGDEGQDELWIITRNNNTFRKVLNPGVSFSVDVPEINGAAVLENGNVLLANGDGDGEEGFIEVSLEDGSIVDAYDTELPLFNGDLAGGCTSGDDSGICDEENGACYATSVEYIQGTTSGGGALSPNRTDETRSLDMPERTDEMVFTTLGYGGSLTFQFDGLVPNGEGDDIEVVETSFNNPGCEAYPEYADVSVSQDGITFYYIGTVCKGDPFVDIADAVDANGGEVNLGCASYVRVANNDDLTSTPDAYDVDGIVALHNCEVAAEDENDDMASIEADGFMNVLSSFPNPTAGISQAVFVTGETTRTTLEVYDMNGRNVATLFNQVANADQEYRVDFNGTSLPNGIYVYRLTTENETIIEKFMIAK